MSILSPNESLNLKQMIKDNNIEDFTETIRNKCHSKPIRLDIIQYIEIEKKYNRLQKSNIEEFKSICRSRCSFLYNNYTDIFNRLVNNTLNLDIFNNILNILHRIETSDIDQHEASYLVGKYLKELYIDSNLRNDKKIQNKSRNQKKHKKVVQKPVQEKSISYLDFKNMQKNKN